MVTKKAVRTYCIDPAEPLAREYNERDIYEQVTVPDIGPSLHHMVSTGDVGPMSSRSRNYTYPDLGDDDNAHDHPDYEKLDHLDLVEKEEYVENFIKNPNNYEKPIEKPKDEEQKPAAE